MLRTNAGKRSEHPPGTMRGPISMTGTLVTNLNGSFHATGERCSQIGGDLAKGKLVGLTVIFPVHGSGLHLRTGRVAKNVRIQFIVRTADPEVFKVRAEGEDAFV